MARIEGSRMLICDGCGVEITWAPVRQKDRIFCCKTCARGLPCRCDELSDTEPFDPRLDRFEFLPD